MASDSSSSPPPLTFGAREWKAAWERDKVYLHVLPRSLAGSVVNISPFAIKLELWLRINKIPFEVVDFLGMSSKGQSPFIMFNEQEIPDSNFVIEFLCTYFKKDPYHGASDVDRAICRAFHKMIEENTSWSIFIYRYVEHTDEYANFFMPKGPAEVRETQLNNIKGGMIERAKMHGIGRHTSEQIHQIGCDDIRAISAFLGTKPFMIGDQPTLVDCVVFGVLSQVVCVPMGFQQRKVILEECPNIVELIDRLKTAYWPEWEEQCEM